MVRAKIGVRRDTASEQLRAEFTGRLVRETRAADRPAVVPTLTDRARITSFSQYVVDTEDPYPDGF